jgi:hypothetical protein
MADLFLAQKIEVGVTAGVRINNGGKVLTRGIIHPPQCLKSRIFSYVNMAWPSGRKVCKSTNPKARKL